MASDDNRLFKRREDVVSRHIAGETILVPIRSKLADMQRIFALNAVGEHIWNEMDGTKTVGDLCGSVVAAFEVSEEEAVKDAQEFLGQLIEAGLVVDAGGAPSP